MKQIFVDTWAWIAINDSHDMLHHVASSIHRDLLSQRYLYITSNFVLAETYTLLRRRVSAKRAFSFGYEVRRITDLNILNTITITPEIEREAWHLFEMYESVNGLSYTDCTSFAAMKARGLRQAFTNDEHFAMAGFERVPSLD